MDLGIPSLHTPEVGIPAASPQYFSPLHPLAPLTSPLPDGTEETLPATQVNPMAEVKGCLMETEPAQRPMGAIPMHSRVGSQAPQLSKLQL